MSRAGLLLAAGLAVAALWPARPGPPGCAEAGEVAAFRGHTTRVDCGAPAPLRGPARLLYGKRLDANLADARSLEALPGIGPARAAALVAARAEGRYCGPADLQRVSGVGPTIAARIAPLLDFRCPGRRDVPGA